MELLPSAVGFVYNMVTNGTFFCTYLLRNKSDQEHAHEKSHFLAKSLVQMKNRDLQGFYLDSLLSAAEVPGSRKPSHARHSLQGQTHPKLTVTSQTAAARKQL